MTAAGQEGREAEHGADQGEVEQDGRRRHVGEAIDAVQHAAVERGERDEQQVGKGDATELDGHGESRRVVAHAGRQHRHHAGHGQDQQHREGHQHQEQGGLRLAREGEGLGASALLKLAGEQRHEGRRERALGEQPAEEIRQLERHEEGIGDGAGPEDGRQHDVARESCKPAQQRKAADRGNGAREAHGHLRLSLP